jgi:hypothetical protein
MFASVSCAAAAGVLESHRACVSWHAVRVTEPCCRQLPLVGCVFFQKHCILSNFVFDILSPATAGAPCRLYITARDRFGNLQLGNSAQHFFYLSQDFTRISVPSVLLSSSLSPLFLDVITSVSGRHRMSILLSSSPGVLVEYFAHSMHWTESVHSEIANGIFPRDHYAVVADDQSHVISKYSRLGVRWTGYLRFSSTQQLTFLLTECEETIL